MKKTSENSNAVAVVVCTDHEKKGVFFGYAEDNTFSKDPIILKRARMAVYWSQETRGVLGLAAKGPQKGSKISDAVPELEVRGVTCVMRATPEAIEAWEKGIWG
jgi:hypothetical protein